MITDANCKGVTHTHTSLRIPKGHRTYLLVKMLMLHSRRIFVHDDAHSVAKSRSIVWRANKRVRISYIFYERDLNEQNLGACANA